MEALALLPMAARKPPRQSNEPTKAPTWPAHLGDLVYAEMKTRGWTQEQVAEHFGVAQSSVARWIDGTSAPRGQRVNQIAEFCHIDMARAFQLNFKMDASAADTATINARMQQLEEAVTAITTELRSVRNQQSVTNEALSTLLDRVKAARDRNPKKP